MPDKDQLKAYQLRLEEAAKRDHRKLGAELDLFSFHEIGLGLAIFHRRAASSAERDGDYSRRRHEQEGYSFVYTPHITKGDLFEQSGPTSLVYKDGMFLPAMHMDEARDEDGNVTRQGADYYLKPNELPDAHPGVPLAGPVLPRDLPQRMFEFGTVYRKREVRRDPRPDRVRGMTQDGPHISSPRRRR